MASELWTRTEWGWDRKPDGRWSAQVYVEEPSIWRVFHDGVMVAEGPAEPGARETMARAGLVMLALAGRLVRERDEARAEVSRLRALARKVADATPDNGHRICLCRPAEFDAEMKRLRDEVEIAWDDNETALALAEALAEVERLDGKWRAFARKVADATPELVVNGDRKICLCGAGEEPGSEHKIRHYAHCVVMLARNLLSKPWTGDNDGE